jgi:hypothetical protein
MGGEGVGAEGRRAEPAAGRALAAHWDARGPYAFLCTFFSLCCVKSYCPADLTITMFVPKYMV